MSSHDMFHSLGQQDTSQDPRRPQTRTQPTAPQFDPPIAPGPGSPYGNRPPNLPSSPYGNQGYGAGGHEQGYFPPSGIPQGQGTPQLGQGDGVVGGLSSQMSGLGVGGSYAGTARGHKKKDRHAYHTLDSSSGSTAAFNGMPSGGAGLPNQFLNTDSPLNQAPGSPYQDRPITPAMSQFPAPANAPFNPANPPSSTEYAARPNFGGSNPPINAASGAPGSQQGRVDPEQVPSIPRSRDAPAQFYLDHAYPTMEQHLPPPAAVPFVAFDQGNSSPKFARL